MAKLQVVTLANLEEFLTLHNAQIATQIDDAVKDSIKSVSKSEDGKTLYFYNKVNPTNTSEAVFSFTVPDPTDDIAKAKKEVLDYVGTIPADAKAKDVVAYIKEAVQAGAYDDSDLKSKVNANTSAIGILNGDGEGSVKKATADAVASLIAGAPESRDTFKELSDWIDSHASDAATMNSQIKTNKNDITALKTLIGTLPDTATSKDLVHYIAEYVSKALADSNLAQYAKAADLEAAVGRITTLEGKMTTVEGKVTTLESDMSTEKPKIAKNASDIAALQGLVGEGYEAIPSESIKGLFSAKA